MFVGKDELKEKFIAQSIGIIKWKCLSIYVQIFNGTATKTLDLDVGKWKIFSSNDASQ